ncbi:MAG: glycosyltransferase [Methylococcales symbiont of Hymedesmia sp. n. MRB-2018]|nr:MAG: glycosyltransferase [Methylococcales symbiont of Hymedesmia sp. n. MRB-2018]KAF3983692.1 MAG: glycosyltransferase [Methylococcales symbiont of Hymedesmia sp. n. MRB-2018]
MKNICIVIDSLIGGGAERVVLTLAKKMVQLGNRVDIITLLHNTNDYPSDLDVTENLNIHHLTTPTIVTKFYNRVLHLKILKQNDKIREKYTKKLLNKITSLNLDFDLFISNLLFSDVICTQANLPNLYCCIHSLISGELKDPNESKTLFYPSYPIRYLGFVKKIYKNQQLITVSLSVKDDLLALGIAPKSVQAIYNPFNFEFIHRQADAYLPNEQDYIIHLGRFVSVKRHDILLKAYKESNVSQKLLLLGKGKTQYVNKIRKLAINLGLQESVIFVGFNPNPYPYTKHAKALILSSDVEGLSMVLIEALILKTPIVSTNCFTGPSAGPSEILVDELKPFLSPVGDVSALADNIKKMVNQPIKITDKYSKRFDDSDIVQQYLLLANRKLC